MQINFRADNAFTRKHARLIWKQFFPDYLRALWLRWFLFLAMVAWLFVLLSLLLSDDQPEWLRGWGLPESFAGWLYGPLAFIIGGSALLLLAELLLRLKSRNAEAQFARLAPPEQASISVSETEVVMQSPTATLTVPLIKVTGLALSKQALAIGFSGAGMILPRSAFATPAEETAFLRAMARGMAPEAVQRSSEAVRAMLH